LPVGIFVARSDVPLESDPVHLDRRENGLLFVDDNDAVLDLTLLPEYERNPYLKHIYGVVRITGLRDVLLGDVAGDKLYINSGYPLHREIFGDTEEDFYRMLELDAKAQTRAVSVLVETAVYHTATTKWQTGGKKGLPIDPDDPIGSLRPYLDESKMRLEPKIYQALVK
jgi:hypothetical protein